MSPDCTTVARPISVGVNTWFWQNLRTGQKKYGMVMKINILRTFVSHSKTNKPLMHPSDC